MMLSETNFIHVSLSESISLDFMIFCLYIVASRGRESSRARVMSMFEAFASHIRNSIVRIRLQTTRKTVSTLKKIALSLSKDFIRVSKKIRITM